MPKTSGPDLSLFLDVLHKLEAIGVPYVIVGGFAATIYGITRSTYDIDIIVDLNEEYIQALASSYPLPRYYADPYQMRQAMESGTSFNIIDTERGEKADLFPITMDERYRPALTNRVRQTVELSEMESFSVWAARPEDVIIGKLMAWTEIPSQRHESDIYEMLVFQYSGGGRTSGLPFDSKYVDEQARLLGEETASFWKAVNDAARHEAGRNSL